MAKDVATFVSKVMAYLKIDEAGKVEKFQEKAIKLWKKQIEVRKDEIADLKEKKEEFLTDRAQDMVFNVDLSQIKGTDERESYITKVYQPRLLSLKAQIEAFDAEITAREKAIEGFEWLIGQVK